MKDTMEETDLKQVLKECNKSAKTGYKIASAQEKNLNRALASAQEKVQSTIIDFNSSPCYAPETTELLEVQLVEIRDAFNRLSFAFKVDLQNLRENALNVFTCASCVSTIWIPGMSSPYFSLSEGNTIGSIV